MCVCVSMSGGGAENKWGRTGWDRGKEGGKGGNNKSDREEAEGRRRRWWWGIKWFNYKPNTISLFLTRDFMVWANVWQKQLSATNAKALHCSRSDGPFGDGRQLLLNFIVLTVFCFFFPPAGINDASTWA